MIRPLLHAVLVLALGFVPASKLSARPAVDALHGRPAPRVTEDRRCSDDGRDCIDRDSYADLAALTWSWGPRGVESIGGPSGDCTRMGPRRWAQSR